MHALTIYNVYATRIITALAGIAGIAVFLYGTLLLGAVAHTAARTSAEKEVRSLSAAVSSLENEFLTETKSLNPERAAALGFVQPQVVTTVYAGAGSLTFGNKHTVETLR